MNSQVNGGGLFRLVGMFAVFVGLAWVLQTVAFAPADHTVASRIIWILAAAAISGAGVGLMLVSRSFSAEPAAL